MYLWVILLLCINGYFKLAGNFLYYIHSLLHKIINMKSGITYWHQTHTEYVFPSWQQCFRVPRGVVMLDHNITQRKYSTIIHVVKTLYFYRSIIALFIIFTAPLSTIALFGKIIGSVPFCIKNAPNTGPCTPSFLHYSKLAGGCWVWAPFLGVGEVQDQYHFLECILW